ncbi:MAG: YggT family protein [Deltaproteobacteria bacterium]|nr:YggT family protein [Deltaproteobacteria bacterium]
MGILANLIEAIATVLDMALTLYMFILIARAVISWVNPDPYNPIVRFLYQATEPVLRPIRNRLPYMGGFDISPIILVFVIVFLKIFLVKSLLQLAFKLSKA